VFIQLHKQSHGLILCTILSHNPFAPILSPILSYNHLFYFMQPNHCKFNPRFLTEFSIPYSFLVFDNYTIYQLHHLGRKPSLASLLTRRFYTDSRLLHGCFTAASRLLHGCFTAASRVHDPFDEPPLPKPFTQSIHPNHSPKPFTQTIHPNHSPRPWIKPFAHTSPSHKPFTETLDQTIHTNHSHKPFTQTPRTIHSHKPFTQTIHTIPSHKTIHINPSHKPFTQYPHAIPSRNTLTPSLPIRHSFLVFDNMSIASHIGRRIGVSRVFHGCFTGVSRVFRRCFAGVSRVFHGCFTGVSQVFRRCFAGVHGYLFGHKNHSPRP
jgi:hypothetical protein